MSTRAITPDTSALEQGSGRHADIMPSDANYMKTGILPSTEDTSDEKEAGVAAGKEQHQQEETHTPTGDEHAAGSKPAPKQTDSSKTTQSAPENRFQKLSRRNRELELENARLKGMQEGREETRRGSQTDTGDKSQSSQPGAEKKPAPMPQIDEIDPKTNKPKYANFAEFNTALNKWNRDEVARLVDEKLGKADQTKAATEAEKIIDQTVNERVAAARKEHADYDDVMKNVFSLKDEHGNEEFFYLKGSHLDGFFLDSDRGHDVMYALGKNWDAHKAIFARDAQGKYLMNPVRQLRELAKIELSLPAKAASGKAAGAGAGSSSTSTTSSARPVSQAPRPAHQTSGTGAVTKEAREQAVEDGDQETYRRSANENDPRLRAWRASQKKN